MDSVDNDHSRGVFALVAGLSTAVRGPSTYPKTSVDAVDGAGSWRGNWAEPDHPQTYPAQRSSPDSDDSPCSWLVAIPTSNSPAPRPRARRLTGPIPASSASTTASRSTSSLRATSPADSVTDGSTGPIRIRSRRRPGPRDSPFLAAGFRDDWTLRILAT